MQTVRLVITEASVPAGQATEETPTLKAANWVRYHLALKQIRWKIIQLNFFLNLPLPVPEPVVEEQDCRIDIDCPSLEICYQSGGRNRCVDPCSTLSPCVAHADCKVHSTTPTRTMSCTCFEGYTGNGVVSCDKISKLEIRFTNKKERVIKTPFSYFSCTNRSWLLKW